MIALIRAGVPPGNGLWADLGAGTGNFTQALRALLGPDSTIYALDRDAKAIAAQRSSAEMTAGAEIRPVQADFTRPLDLPPLDGVLMANALHFVRDQATVLAHVAGYLRPAGRFLLVEYDVPSPMPWVPFPVPPERFEALARQAGLSVPQVIGSRRSPSTGIRMYAAVALRKPTGQGSRQG
jgi:SAM-dependent methyltransferase